MLSTGAFNALLKTLEEPPEHVMFILATTEPQKLPLTILSRCMRLDFRRVPQRVIADDMRKICMERGVSITDDAIRLLANSADGSVRDGLSILDQVLAGGDKEIDRERVLEYVGTIGEDFFIDLTELVSLRKSADALVLLNSVLQEGKDVKQLMKDWVSHYRSLLITKFVKDAEDMLNMSAENLKRVSEQSKQISLDEIDFAVTKLSKTINDARWSTNPRVLFELAIVSIAAGENYEEKVVRRVPSQVVQQVGQAEPQAPVQVTQHAPSNAHYDAPVQSKPRIQTVESHSHEYDELWSSIFEEGEASDGSYNLIRLGTKLTKLTEDTFTVIANGSFTQGYVEQKKADLERFMSSKMGKKMKLVCKLQSQQEVEPVQDDTDEIAKEAEELLGIKIDIE
jgi:DNA polymerase-3 subunit gamma/tau